MNIAGKTAFVTGGSLGIGRGMVSALAARGAKVFFIDINVAKGKELEADLQKKYGAKVVIFRECDVTDGDALKASFDAAVAAFGNVDICCNNAGILDESIWERMLAINTTAPIRGSMIALEHMRRDKGGRGGVILNTVSIVGMTNWYHMPIYVGTKHAMLGFTQSRAADPHNKEYGVRWCSLCPMPVNTDLMVVAEDKVIDLDEFRVYVKATIIEPEDVVSAFLRLLQDEGNNGSIMEVTAAHRNGRYRKRIIVNADGVSEPFLVDTPEKETSLPYWPDK
ncbi:15-hydroxyprostaglandin dehydrogenase [NAD(+)]-like [Pomacea canaliculata]|uniref:15-hydroxyprostaglandin dehydrogenase [NAD(+)]-like n=1 Tax=Pomacea canaliculata TaxID=400727 RepID=UPI000D7381F4|nr:15-hydroxyprostaglandin dehydrogenase [NAD(+)]-like [Pomacea canaliculata]